MANTMKSAIYAIGTTALVWSSLMVLDDPKKLIDVAEGSLAVLALAAILMGWLG